MTCAALMERLGFACHEKEQGVYLIDTPVCFSDGEPVTLYFRDRGNSVIVSDNADTVCHLMGLGVDMTDRRKWRGIRNILEEFGLELVNSGEVIGQALNDGAEALVSRYLAAMAEIGGWERELMSLSESMAEYLEEVEHCLRHWKPETELKKSPIVVGHSGRSHNFDFLFGDRLIDAAKPNSGRTGAILRKAVDIQNTSSPMDVLVVMDDRDDPERAAAETDILSTSVAVFLFSRLSQRGDPILPRRH